MKGTQFEFRFRMLIGILVYVLGFWAPWERYTAASTTPSTAWLELSSIPARLHWLDLGRSTELVTSLAIFFAFAGAALRVWGTAYLGASTMTSASMRADQVMAAGPYRRVRNPLYLGTWSFSLGVAILMPAQGAIFFLVAIAILYFRLILGEEDFLARQLGAPYLEYKHRVRRLLPSLSPRVPASAVRPLWGVSVLAEIYPVGMTLCLATLAWRYNVPLLIQCVLVCFGLSLIVRALLPRTGNAGKTGTVESA